MKAGELWASLGLDTSGYEEGMQAAGKTTMAFGVTAAAHAKMVASEFGNLEKQFLKFSEGYSTGLQSSAQLAGMMASMILNPVTITLGSLAALTAGIIDLISTTSEFEKSWAEVTTILHKSSGEISAFRNDLLFISPELGGATELAEAMYQALSSGIPAEKAVRSVGEAAKFAKAALVDQFTAIDIGTTIINSYGMEVEGLNRVYNILFKTIELGKVTGEELAGSIGRIMPVAAALNVPLEEVMSLIAALSLGGLDAAEAVTALRQSMAQFLSPTAEAKNLVAEMSEEYPNLSIELSAAAVRQKGFTKALLDLAEASEYNDEAIGTFFNNVRALVGVLALTGNQADNLVYIMKQMGVQADWVSLAMEKMNDTLSGQWKILGDTLDRFKIFLGLPTGGALKNVLDDINTALERALELVEKLDNMEIPPAVSTFIALINELKEFSAGEFPGKFPSEKFIGFKIGTGIGKEFLEWREEAEGLVAEALEPLWVAFYKLTDPKFARAFEEAAKTSERLKERLNHLVVTVAETGEKAESTAKKINVLSKEQKEFIKSLEEEIPELEIKLEASSEYEAKKAQLRLEYNRLTVEYADHMGKLETIRRAYDLKGEILDKAENDRRAKEAKIAADRVEKAWWQSERQIIESGLEGAAKRRAQAEFEAYELRQILGDSAEAQIQIERLKAARLAEIEADLAEERKRVLLNFKKFRDGILLTEREQIFEEYKTERDRLREVLAGSAELNKVLEDLREVYEKKLQGFMDEKEAKQDDIRERQIEEEKRFLESLQEEWEEYYLTKEEQAKADYERQKARIFDVATSYEQLMKMLDLLDDIYKKQQDEFNHWIILSERTSEAMEDAFSTFFFEAMKGELDDLEDYFLSFLRSIQQAIAEAMGQMMKEFMFGKENTLGGIFGALVGMIGGLFGPTAVAAPAVGPATGLIAAKGVAFDRGEVLDEYDTGGAFYGGRAAALTSGRVVNQPTIFPMASGFGLMGEKGPEAVMPLVRTPGGSLGIEAMVGDEGGGKGVESLNVTIFAVDAKSFADMTRRNPEAIINPIVKALKGGNVALRTVLRNTR